MFDNERKFSSYFDSHANQRAAPLSLDEVVHEPKQVWNSLADVHFIMLFFFFWYPNLFINLSD